MCLAVADARIPAKRQCSAGFVSGHEICMDAQHLSVWYRQQPASLNPVPRGVAFRPSQAIKLNTKHNKNSRAEDFFQLDSRECAAMAYEKTGAARQRGCVCEARIYWDTPLFVAMQDRLKHASTERRFRRASMKQARRSTKKSRITCVQSVVIRLSGEIVTGAVSCHGIPAWSSKQSNLGWRWAVRSGSC